MPIGIGLFLGIVFGVMAPVGIPAHLTRYVAVGLLAAIDSLFGGISARWRKEFHLSLFISGLLGNALVGAGITYLGEKMGIELYLAAIVLFGSRLLKNFAQMRRILLTNGVKKDKIDKIQTFETSHTD